MLSFALRTATDAIFSLLSIVHHYLNNNKRLYVAYIDMKKCFDSIYRNAVWYKLYKYGLGGKLLNVIKSMYCHVRSCVKHCNNFSDFLNIR